MRCIDFPFRTGSVRTQLAHFNQHPSPCECDEEVDWECATHLSRDNAERYTVVMNTSYDGLRIELANCESTLLREIAEPSWTRRLVAQTYALALRSSERGKVDWKKVNQAIVERWSLSALNWIKRQAWSGKCWNYEAIQ